MFLSECCVWFLFLLVGTVAAILTVAVFLQMDIPIFYNGHFSFKTMTLSIASASTLADCREV